MFLMRFCCYLLAVGFSSSVLADFGSAYKLFQQKEYDQALPQLQILAQLGHPQAQLLLSQCYEEGLGTDVDINKAYGWALTAKGMSQPGAAEKYVELRAKLESRRAGKQAYTEINGQYGELALKSNLYPTIHQVYRQPALVKPIRQDKPEYPNYYDRSGVAAWSVVTYDINENGQVENAKVALSFPTGSIDKFVLKAMEKWTFTPPRNSYGDAIRVDHQIHVFNMDKMVTASRKFERENNEYISAIRAAAEANSAAQQYKFGLIAQAGLVKGEKPLPWYLKSAINGYAPAQFTIAQCLLSGSMCDKDSNKAINWLTYAAADGDPQASYLLSHQLLDSDNIQFDPERAAQYLERAAAKNYVPAIVEYASLLAMSDNPKLRNAEKAIALAEKGLEQDEDNPKLLSTIGVALIEQGKQERGEEMLEQAVDAAEDRNWATDNYRDLLNDYRGQVQAETK